MSWDIVARSTLSLLFLIVGDSSAEGAGWFACRANSIGELESCSALVRLASSRCYSVLSSDFAILRCTVLYCTVDDIPLSSNYFAVCSRRESMTSHRRSE